MKAKSKLTNSLNYFLVFFLLFSSVINTEIFSQERTIALVYDDSGSMGNVADGEPCRAVNYALQLIVGLLNPADKFYVVKMSQPAKLIEINLKAKPGQIETIREWMCKGDTPFKAADTAMRALEADKNKNTDKWLIIFTDGVMEINADNETRIKKFVTDSGAKTIILNINTAENPLADAYQNIGQAKIYSSTTGLINMRTNMESIALSVMSMTQSGLTVNTANHTVKLDSLFPLKRLILLEQNTDRTSKLLTVDEVTDNNGVKILVEGIYDAFIPNRIYGRVTHILEPQGSNQVIPEGEIRINFNGSVDVSRFKFLPEVAAKLDAKAIGDNILIEKKVKDNVYPICENQNEVDVQAQLTTLDGRGLKPGILKNTKVHIYYNNIKEEMRLTGDVFTKRIKVDKKLLPISVSAEYPGYFNFRTNVFFIEKIYCKRVGIRLEEYPTVKVTELDKAPFINLIPLINDKKATKEQFKDLYLSRTDNAEIDIDIQEADTYWKIRPKAKWGIPCFTKTGKHQVVLDLRSKRKDILPYQGPTTIVFEIQDESFLKKCAPFIFVLLFLIFLSWYILGLIKKPRFCRGSEVIYQRSAKFVKNREISYSLPGKFITRFLIPYLPETAKIEGIKFKAGKRCGYIELPKEVQGDGMYISGNLLEDYGRRDYRLSIGDELLVKHRNYKETYRYSKI